MSHTQTPIDASIAERIARGHIQKRWLQEMLTPAGMNPADGVYSPPLWRRIHAFLEKLWLAGYVIQQLPLEAPSYGRYVITGYVPAAAPLLGFLRTNAGNSWSDRPAMVRYGELLAWVEQAAPEVLIAAATIAPWFSGSLEDLLAVAPGVALGRALRATPEWRR